MKKHKEIVIINRHSVVCFNRSNITAESVPKTAFGTSENCKF